MKAPHPWLWRIANGATVVCLLWTVLDFVRIASAARALPHEQEKLALARGISAAMNHTAVGLAVAFLCIAAHMVLDRATPASSQ